jgi:nucleotide-binding universal stress UspA family protein
MRLDRIVIGMDLSDASREVARWTARVLAPGAEIVLAHVVDVPTPPAPLQGTVAPTDTLEATARTGADKLLREIAAAASIERCWIEVRSGSPADTLTTIATEYGADLLVVGAHRTRDGLWNWLGTTAEKLLGQAPVPVLLVVDPPATPRHVIAAVDGSEISTSVEGWAHALARGLRAEVKLLTVVGSAVPAHLLAEAGADAATATTGGAPAAAGRDAWIERELGSLGASAIPEVTFGEPGQEILAAAQRMGDALIVVGRRGAGRARRALFGSVTRELLRGARCPVLVVLEPRATG